MALILDKVNYIYNPGTAFERHAIKDISLCINEGEFIGIIGHTGSGKSTLIQHLNGLIKPTSGEIYFNGMSLSNPEFKMKDLRQKVGLVFQYPEYQLFEETVSKDVLFGPGNMDLTTLEREKRSYDALRDVGITDDLLDASPFDLSGGQKRRVAIAGVLAMQPEILILDEPAAGLDPKGRRDILSLLERIRKERNIAVIIVSHSMEDVAEFADRIIVMDKGSVIMDDSPARVFANYQQLESIGLDIPVVSRICNRMRKEGYTVSEDVLTMTDAINALK